MGLFSRSSSSDAAAEAVLVLDLSNSPSARDQAHDALRQLPTEAVRTATQSLPESKGREVAEAIVRRADSRAFDEARMESSRRNRHY